MKVFELLKKGEYQYNIEYIGRICCGTGEGQDGLYHYVTLYGDHEEDIPYAQHSISIGNNEFCCQEYPNSSRTWYFNDEEINISDKDTHIIKALNHLDSILKPFDFQNYAIDSFDADCIAEAVPYGDPHCLIIDGCVFMIEEDVNNFDEDKIRNFLKEYNWSQERIDMAIKEGYEITSDVWGELSFLNIVYDEP